MANGLMTTNNVAVRAAGGTELMGRRLHDSIPHELLDRFQIWFSRYRPADVDPTKYQIFYAHDLPEDPESAHLANEGWRKFHHLVFVSNWQMQRYCAYYGIPYNVCSVLLNAIEPIPVQSKPDDVIRIGYWSTPHRGLNILVPVFSYLSEKYDNIELDVFSSFGLYGWEDRDEPYKPLFQKCIDHPKINYHGAVDNETLREYASSAHILAYPSIWTETSCLVLMEAMSAQMLCIHPNLGALYETAANWTQMYQWANDYDTHAARFHAVLEQAIISLNTPLVQSRLQSQKSYADTFYNWNIRAIEWMNLLQAITELSVELPWKRQDTVILER